MLLRFSVRGVDKVIPAGTSALRAAVASTVPPFRFRGQREGARYKSCFTADVYPANLQHNALL